MIRLESGLIATEMVRVAEGVSAPRLTLSPRIINETLRVGLCAGFIKELSMSIPFTVIAQSLDVSKQALRRKVTRNTCLTKSQSDAIFHLVITWHELLTFFNNDRSLLSVWLLFELPALDNAKPEELLSTNYGRKVLTSFIDEMRYGEFA